MSLTTNKNVGAYVRLSNDDPLQATSIENQIEVITNYCNENHLSLKKVYSDYGFTGRNFERPQFKQMMIDLKAGIINCIIVKDISRFGRTLLGVGKYIEETFVKQNIRFISIMDNFDTKEYQEDDTMVIKMFLNDYYVKECSKKLKQTFARQSKVQSLTKGGFYGYIKDEKGNLIVDPITSPIVKRIFETYKQVQTTSLVAQILNEENIPTPIVYRKSRGLTQGRKLDEHHYFWNSENILDILKRYEYTGAAVNMKEVHDKQRRGREIILENNHEPIISKELFEEVKQIRASHNKKNQKDPTKEYAHVEHLSKFLYCPVCGHAYVYCSERGTSFYYVDKHCKVRLKLPIVHDVLYQRSLLQINKAKFDSDKFVETIKNVKLDNRRYKKLLEELEEEQGKNDALVREYFEEYALGKISKEDYGAKMEILNDNNNYLEKKRNDLILYKYKENEVHQKAVSFMNDLFNLNVKKLSQVTVIQSVIDKVVLTKDNDEITINEIKYRL
ncbi:MAG: recombinase family protein [Anaeroplasmataceae bacterium]|nr:recombinase family protein [Anaeroplasmataceae bacterium]